MSSTLIQTLSLSLSLSLSLLDRCLSLKDRCFTLSFAQINVSLLVGHSLDGSLSFCLVPPWWTMVISGCGIGGHLGLVMSHGVSCGHVVESHSYIPSQASMATFRASIGLWQQ